MKRKKANKQKREIQDYDFQDTTAFLGKRRTFEELGVTLPDLPPTQVVSIRLPTALLNELRALGSQQDVPYQALVKLFLAEAVEKAKRKDAA